MVTKTFLSLRWQRLFPFRQVTKTPLSLRWQRLFPFRQASGQVSLPVRTVRTSHTFGGAINRSATTLFRGVMRDVFVTAASVDPHHRGHLQTHSGPTKDWERQWRDSVGLESCGVSGCVCNPATAPVGRRLQGVPQAVPDTPTGYVSSLQGGNASSALGVNGGSVVLIGGQFGEVAYPEAQAPVVMIGTTSCGVDLLESTARLIYCTVEPLTAAVTRVGFEPTWPSPCKPEPFQSLRNAEPLLLTAQVRMVSADWVGSHSSQDLEGKSGKFTLDLVVYTPQAIETDSGQVVATPNPATCTLTSGCKVQFDLDTQPAVSSLRTGIRC